VTGENPSRLAEPTQDTAKTPPGESRSGTPVTKTDPPKPSDGDRPSPAPQPATFTGFEGKWSVRITPEMRKQMEASKVSGVELSLTFTAPDRFKLTAKSNEKGAQTVLGKAKIEGSKVLLTPTEIDGKAPSTPGDAQTLGLQLDAKQTTLTSDDGRMIFERDA